MKLITQYKLLPNIRKGVASTLPTILTPWICWKWHLHRKFGPWLISMALSSCSS